MTKTAEETTQLVSAAGRFRWDAAREAGPACEHVLARIGGRPDLLLGLATEVLADPGAGESYPQMDKLVLWRSQDGDLRLRLHVFSRGYRDRPHNHRWSFASTILAGSYRHTIYGSSADVIERGDLRPLWTAEHRAGESYFLDSDAVHSLHVDQLAVSLVLRGPATKDRYFTMVPAGPAGGEYELRWDYGAAKESAEKLTAKTLSQQGAERIIAALEALAKLPD